jgi:hypothetical protein
MLASTPTNLFKNMACPAKARGVMLHDLCAYSLMERGSGNGESQRSEDEKFCSLSCWRKHFQAFFSRPPHSPLTSFGNIFLCFMINELHLKAKHVNCTAYSKTLSLHVKAITINFLDITAPPSSYMLYQCIPQPLLVFSAFYPIKIVPLISPNTFFVMDNKETLNILRKHNLTYV